MSSLDNTAGAPRVDLPEKQKIIAGKWGLRAAKMSGGWVVEWGVFLKISI